MRVVSSPRLASSAYTPTSSPSGFMSCTLVTPDDASRPSVDDARVRCTPALDVGLAAHGDDAIADHRERRRLAIRGIACPDSCVRDDEVGAEPGRPGACNDD